MQVAALFIQSLLEDLQEQVGAIYYVLPVAVQLAVHKPLVRLHTLVSALFEREEAAVNVSFHPGRPLTRSRIRRRRPAVEAIVEQLRAFDELLIQALFNRQEAFVGPFIQRALV